MVATGVYCELLVSGIDQRVEYDWASTRPVKSIVILVY